MRFRILSLVGFCTVLAAPQVFAEDLPAPATLGQVESLMDSCSKADPKSAPDLKTQHERLVQGVSEKDLAKVRAADEYQRVYKEFSALIARTSRDEAMKACKVFVGMATTPRQDSP
jgi:hypothetical protein